MPHKSYKKNLKTFINSIWLFPALLTIALITFTALGISGSSIGIYDILAQDKNTNLIAGKPKTVRSDEWLVTTPLTFAQVKSGYPVVNHDIGDGQDMAVAMDVPYKEWSILFKPQNLSFFVMPLAQAFAFKWWFIVCTLMLGVYFLFILLYRRKLPATLLAIFFAFSPFVQWWYQSITILTLGYAFLLVTLAILLTQAASHKLRILYTATLFYLLSCFALLMYPAFQVPTAIFAAVVFIAWYLAHYPWRNIFSSKLWIYFGGAIISSGAVVLSFLIIHSDAVRAISHTIYPGSRYVASGGEDPSTLAYWPFLYLLKNDQYAATFNSNPSGASHFLLFGLLCLPGLAYYFFFKKRTLSKTSRYLLVGALGLCVLFLLRMFMPHTDIIFNLLGLSSTPHERLRIVFGLISLLLMGIAVAGVQAKGRISLKPTLITGAASALLAGGSLLYSRHAYQLPTVGRKEIAFIGLSVVVICVLMTLPKYQYRLAGLMFATIYTVVATYNVNPLYRGTSDVVTGSATHAISRLEAGDNLKWIVDDYFPLENLPIVAGAESVGGTYSYPQLKTWQKYFPGQENIYNRYAHIDFKINDQTTKDSLELRQFDQYFIHTSSCSQLLKDMGVGYLLSTSAVDKYECFDKAPSTPTDSPFIIYKRSK